MDADVHGASFNAFGAQDSEKLFIGAGVCERKLRRKAHNNRNIADRLRSIVHDAQFVREIAQLHPRFPLVANLRCGLWYQRSFDHTCYFKSTDGHANEWCVAWRARAKRTAHKQHARQSWAHVGAASRSRTARLPPPPASSQCAHAAFLTPLLLLLLPPSVVHR